MTIAVALADGLLAVLTTPPVVTLAGTVVANTSKVALRRAGFLGA